MPRTVYNFTMQSTWHSYCCSQRFHPFARVQAIEVAMREWLRRIRAAVGMGVTWAIGWAPVGLLIGLILGGNRSVPDGFPADDWLVPFAILGFFGGTIFSGVLRLAEGRRRFDELSLPRFGALGGLGGMVLGFIAVAAWQLDAGFGPVVWPAAAVIVGSASLLSAASASGSLALARRAEDRELLGSGSEVAAVGLKEAESQKLIEGRK